MASLDLKESDDRIPNSEKRTLRKARKLAEAGKEDEARAILEATLSSSVPSLKLLETLVYVCDLQGAAPDAMKYARQALALDSKGPQAAALYMRVLYLSDNMLSALEFYRSLPKKTREHGKVQLQLYLIYGSVKCPAKAAKAAKKAGLNQNGLVQRIRHIGLVLIRRPRGDLEQDRLDQYRHWARGLLTISSVEPRFDSDWLRIKGEIDRYLRSWVLQFSRRDFLDHMLLPLYPLLLILVAPTAGARFSRPPVEVSTVSNPDVLVSLVFAIATFLVLNRLWNNWASLRRNLLTAIPILAGVAGISALLGRDRDAETFRWWIASGIAVAILTFLFAVVVDYLLDVLVVVYLFRRLRRDNVRAAILDMLIDLRMESSDRHRIDDLGWREDWIANLERLAQFISREAPRSLSPLDVANKDWFEGRVAGAAAGIRRLKRMIISPAGDSWSHVQRIASQYIVALAAGNWGALPYVTPPPQQEPPSRRARVASLGKSVVIASLPIAALLLVDPLVKSEPPALDWAKVLAIVWFVVTVLFALDPEARQKIQTVRELSASIRAESERSSRPQADKRKDVEATPSL